ncbi:MAG: phage neck terminator protein [Caulobacteraceae bacterium]
MSLSITEYDIRVAMENVLRAFVPAGVSVIRGQVNRTAPPKGNYIVATVMGRVRLATNTDSYDGVATKTITQPTQVTVQLDLHGELATDVAQILSSVFRDAAACDAMPAAIQPLYADDPRQMPFINGAQQYEDRWTVNVVLQVNPALSLPQAYAGELHVHMQSLDAYRGPAGFLQMTDGRLIHLAGGGRIELLVDAPGSVLGLANEGNLVLARGGHLTLLAA